MGGHSKSKPIKFKIFKRQNYYKREMKKLFATALLVLAGLVSYGQGAFKFENEEYDFGDVKEGDVATHVFKFKNTGNAPIVITNVQASCGCTTPEWSREPIMPGETGQINVGYNSKSRPGNFFKTITISSNATEPNKIIKIKGNVIMPPQPAQPVPGSSGQITPPVKKPSPVLELIDTEYNFGKIQIGSEITRKVKFRNTGDAPLQVRSLFSECRCVSLKKFTPNVAVGQSGEIEFTFRPLKVSTKPQAIQILIDAETQQVNQTFWLSGEVVETLVPKSVVQEVKKVPAGW